MSKFKRKALVGDGDNEDSWIITYADAVTLILCFFVILFSVSEPKDSAFKKVAEAFQAAGFIEEITEDPFEVILEQIEIMIEDNQLERDMSVEETDKGIMLELSSSSFYQPGSAKFKPEAIPILQQVGQTLKDFDYDAYVIDVEGHTDDVPISTPMYPSNWELSGNRAANVVRFFIADNITPERLRATGLADVEPKVPNLDEQGNPIPANRELNRRVVIKIERTEL